MRETKFRGKSKFKNVWHYGSLINNAFFLSSDNSAVPYILDTDDIDYDNFVDIAEQLDDFELIPESVGQYTNLKDKNGKEIYEGDILQVGEEYCGTYSPTYVTFEDGSFRHQISHMHNPVVLNNAKVMVLEVIGNIYENPEMLRE
ncbi:hypothetical protein CHI07_16995 [Paenibacillus sp. 7884-2]|nr:hypothetical protein CHI07_16995 [Paenibacillus sp. 7884-2]